LTSAVVALPAVVELWNRRRATRIGRGASHPDV
jgi:hypothetical protein